MVPTISDLPDEVLSRILKYVLASDTPMDLECFIGSKRNYNFQLTNMSPDGTFCHQPLCHYLKKVAGFSQIHLLDCNHFPSSQAAHAQAWIIANSVSDRFRSWAKEAFFSERVFLLELDLLRRLQIGKVRSLSAENANLMIKHAEQIIAPVPVCSSASAFISLPRYQLFQHLRVLTIWLGIGKIETTPDFTSGDLKEEVHVEVFEKLLGNIGLDVGRTRLKVIRPAGEDAWQWRMRLLESHCFPYLRWLGEEKRKSRREGRTEVI